MNGHRSSEAAQNRQDPETNRPSLLPSIVCDGQALWQRSHVTADYRRLEARHPWPSPTSAPAAAPTQARIGQEAVAPPLSSATADSPPAQAADAQSSQERKQRGVVGVIPQPTQEPGRCLGVSGRGSSRIEYPSTLVRGCSGDEHSPMLGVFLTHSAAQAVHALRSGRPRAQGGWVKGSCLVREAVPTDRRRAALKQRSRDRLRGTNDER